MWVRNCVCMCACVRIGVRVCVIACVCVSIGVNLGNWWSRPLRFWDGGSWGLREILSSNVQEYEMKTLSRVVTFQK